MSIKLTDEQIDKDINEFKNKIVNCGKIYDKWGEIRDNLDNILRLLKEVRQIEREI